MKILIVGDFYWEIYAKSFYKAFQDKTTDVIKFDTDCYFKSKPNLVGTGKKKREIQDLWYLFQCKYNKGPIIYQMNYDLKSLIKSEMPDLVFLYRDRFIRPSVLKYIKSKNIKIFAYNNDNPFSSEYKNYFWENYFGGVSYCDYVFAYRHSNIEEYKRIGVDNLGILRSYYLREKNYFIDESILDSQYQCDISFIGHFEKDGRDGYLKELLIKGYNVKLYGSGWENSKYYDFLIQNLGEIKHLQEDYNLAINSAKIALVFLSKLNKDTYTRRCFEIPATKTFMLAEFTEDLSKMFKEGEEAEYFRDIHEFMQKIEYYLKHDKERKKIGRKGYRRLISDGHEVRDRVDEVIRVHRELIHSKGKDEENR
ncbi:CgeB family protein [Salipaludibacillus sp. CF4.18]|uniref:CgeB family protein n=1 Tax=Salipaludibacillus sp. CF4.18 TaxID=3373081 RepID=UPI003EE63C80